MKETIFYFGSHRDFNESGTKASLAFFPLLYMIRYAFQIFYQFVRETSSSEPYNVYPAISNRFTTGNNKCGGISLLKREPPLNHDIAAHTTELVHQYIGTLTMALSSIITSPAILVEFPIIQLLPTMASCAMHSSISRLLLLTTVFPFGRVYRD